MTNANKNNEDLDSYMAEPLNDERLRRMKRLLRDMYREEFTTQKLRLPPIKARFLILTLSFVSILVFGVTTLYNFNRFVTLEERVLSAEGHVQDVLQRRRNLFHNLINMTLNNAVFEGEIVQQVTDRRTEIGRGREGDSPVAHAPPPAIDKGALARLMGDGELGKEAMGQLLAIAEQYPSVTTTVTYQQLMDKLVEMEDRISHRRDEYNEEVRIYNTLITSFPWYFLARVTGFRRAEYYHATHTEVPTMAPDGFLRLLPPKTVAASKKALPTTPPTERSTGQPGVQQPVGQPGVQQPVGQPGVQRQESTGQSVVASDGPPPVPWVTPPVLTLEKPATEAPVESDAAGGKVEKGSDRKP
ncbi:MAG: LemA family protein [Magnetococcales bacterium]|nr:LemA family protein [Magnetococcales bacterium]